ARGLIAGRLRTSSLRELTQHERHWCRDRITRHGHSGTRRPAALDDLYRAVDLCRLPAVAIRADPSHGRLRPHLYFEPDRRSLPHHLRSLLLADACDRAGRRGRKRLSRRAVGSEWRKGARRRCARPAGRAGHRSHPQPGDEGEGASHRSDRPDAVVADAGRPAARFQRFWRVRVRYADEARPARHHHRFHHHAGADRHPGCGRQGRDENIDGSDERRHGGGHVHDAGGPDRLHPGPHSILHARCRDPAGVFRCRRADRDPRHPGIGKPVCSGKSWNAAMMDDFGLYPREEPFDPLGVMLFKALQVIAFLFFLALLAVSPDAKDGKIDSKAEFIITMDWPDSHPDDFDLFVQDPAGNIAWYRRREAGFLTLDRDDRGGANDFIIVNGKKILSPIREEIVTVRGIVPGEYTVNVSHFQATTGQPVAVSVKVQKLNPTAQVIFDNKLTLDHSGHEKPAVRFWLDAAGKVIDV